jgi:oligopeptide transport system ATP-binding protein
MRPASPTSQIRFGEVSRYRAGGFAGTPVFQDPYGSLNPRWRILDIVAEPLIGYNVGDGAGRRRRVRDLLALVGLNPDVYGRRHPRELSGGQAQRVAIAPARSH